MHRTKHTDIRMDKYNNTYTDGHIHTHNGIQHTRIHAHTDQRNNIGNAIQENTTQYNAYKTIQHKTIQYHSWQTHTKRNNT